MEPVFPFSLDLPGTGTHQLARTLHAQLRAAILDQRLPAGTRLPATRRVASAFGIGRNTVIAAYELLAAEGYVVVRPGARAEVAQLGARRPRAAGSTTGARGEARLAPQWRQAAWSTPRPAGPAAGTRGFEIGIPEHRGFPLHIWRRLLGRTLRRATPRSFGYQEPDGLPALREAIARHVAATRAVVCGADDIIVTSGAKQAFDLLARLLVTPGRTRVAVEDPGYPSLRMTFAAAGAQLSPVPVDGHGLRVDRLREDAGIVCVTPSHQFPTGVAMTMDRRMQLLEFARQHRAVVIEDDYDSEFRYAGRPLDALQTLDRDGSVFYVGTFSKSLFPSLRIGYLVAPAWARPALATLRHCTDTHGNTQLQQALADFIHEGHLLRHARRMHRLYAARRQRLLDAFEGGLRPWLWPLPSQAGLHLAALPRDPASLPRLLAQARRCTPGVQPLADFALGPIPRDGLVFGYGNVDEAAIDGYLQRLTEALDALDLARDGRQ